MGKVLLVYVNFPFESFLQILFLLPATIIR